MLALYFEELELSAQEEYTLRLMSFLHIKAYFTASCDPPDSELLGTKHKQSAANIRRWLAGEKMQFRRIDGTTSLEDREKAINDFNRKGSDVFVFLLSIRAAGRGLNLQVCLRFPSSVASHVLFLNHL